MADPHDNPTERLLYSRREAARVLSIHPMTLIRMEWAGTLTPIKLNANKRRGKTFYSVEQVHAIARGVDAMQEESVPRVRVTKSIPRVRIVKRERVEAA